MPDARRVPRVNRNFWWVLGTVPVVAVLAAFGLRIHGVQRDVGRWQEYQRASAAAGEDLGIANWLPAPVAESDDLMKHPWMVGFLSSETSPEAKVVASMQPEAVPGLEYYEVPAYATSWFDGKVAEIDRVLDLGGKEWEHLRGIHDAIARSGCTVPIDLERPMESAGGSWTRLSAVSKALALQADAAIASGKEDAAVATIESILRLGGHFAGKNSLISTIIGAGAEAQALGLIELGLARHAFSENGRKRLLAALPTRDLPRQMATVMRVERGIFLKEIAPLAKLQPAGSVKSLRGFFYPPERVVAANSLFYCETLDAVLTPPLSRETWDRFEDVVRAQEAKYDPDGYVIAGGVFRLFGGVGKSLMFQEAEEMDLIRRRLAE
ncbi:hypothetical protein OKA04_11015 [Luteolibacter flavescens]|uniref:Uncharacterized protein n=1 Tax=Luteolibacter flavescens TaxID=1859460 RepID=A0ABT3FNW9_9BACT|nr:hypothetical protein [Luteolibacter flavescens]MCW1885260.1 hypothetical protein [Luteolibacter flavescens]